MIYSERVNFGVVEYSRNKNEKALQMHVYRSCQDRLSTGKRGKFKTECTISHLLCECRKK